MPLCGVGNFLHFTPLKSKKNDDKGGGGQVRGGEQGIISYITFSATADEGTGNSLEKVTATDEGTTFKTPVSAEPI